jgi:uncharacterized membrane protein
MAAFHFCFDLNHFGFARWNFYNDPLWLIQRAAIVSLFIFSAGYALATAASQGQTSSKFMRRIGEIAMCALLVSAATYAMNPRTYIYFGILHGIAANLLIARPMARFGASLWPIGLACIAAPAFARSAHAVWPALAWMNHPPFNVFGMVSELPVTEDFAPILPWLGVALLGMASCQWSMSRAVQNGGPTRPNSEIRWLAPLAKLGRHSLAFYMSHQIVLYGAVWSARALVH